MSQVEPLPSALANQTQQDGGAVWLASLLDAATSSQPHQALGRILLPSSSPLVNLAGALTLVALVAYAAYRQALPKPLPGIPYNPGAAGRVLGDLPELFALVKEGDTRSFFSSIAARLNSPIVQFFGMPFARPILLVSDFRAAQDILLRRSKEFDRPMQQIEALKGVLANHHITMQTSDPQFRKNRELVKDLMTPNFLHTVNAPEIWRGALYFVELWKWKARVAGGRAFEAAADVSTMTFDTIRNVAVGRDGKTMMETYFEQLRAEFDGKDLPPRGTNDKEEAPAFAFPEPPTDGAMEALHRFNESVTPGAAGLPMKLFHKINNLRPYMREAFANKDRMMQRQVELAVQRHEAGEPLDSALDFMIRREINAAKKAERAPVFDSPSMHDELFGYLGAGHDTTATTFQWGLKHLAQQPDAQQKARAGLRAAYAEAYQQGRPPTAAEIVKTQVPYLEAILEEVLRVSAPISTTARVATVDTTIMGHAVPKGTMVFVTIFGPDINMPSVQSPDLEQEKASESRSYKQKHTWDGSEPEKFLPERWLQRDDDGRLVYDAQSGPLLTFGLGVRGCFGRRLAYLTMRILLTLLLWHFELEPVPEELDSWKAVQILTRKPTQCYVRLREVEI